VLAGFKDIKTTADLSLVVTPDENTRRAKALRAMLARVPEHGKNDILVTHRPTSSMHSARTGSTSRKARHPSSSQLAPNIT